MGSDVDAFIVNFGFRNINLNVASCLEFKFLTWREFYHKFFDKGSHIIIGNHLTFPFFDTEYFFWHTNLHVAAHLYLACKAFMFSSIFTADVVQLGRQDISASFVHFAPAHGAGSSATTGRWEENVFIGKSAQQSNAWLNDQGISLVAIYDDFYITLGYEPFLSG